MFFKIDLGKVGMFKAFYIHGGYGQTGDVSPTAFNIYLSAPGEKDPKTGNSLEADRVTTRKDNTDPPCYNTNGNTGCFIKGFGGIFARYLTFTRTTNVLGDVEVGGIYPILGCPLYHAIQGFPKTVS